MGGGGSSSSSSSTHNTNINGTSAVSGDNLGVLVSGVGGNVSVSNTTTDHGAIKAAKSIADNALASNNQAMRYASDLSSEALKTNERTFDKSLSFAEKSLEKVSDTNSEALTAVKELAAQSNENTRAALKAAQAAKTHEQVGAMPELTKVALGVSAAFTVGVMALAWSHK